MKNTQKKKITGNYCLLTKVESGKCCRGTAAIDVICHVKSQERGKTSLQCPSGVRRNKTQTAVINMEPKRMLNKVNFLDVSYVQHTSSEVTVN